MKSEKIKAILKGDDELAKKALFQFSVDDDEKKIRLKFNLWIRYNFPKYFTSKDAPFHREIDLYNIRAYKGNIDSFVDIAFRGAAKTARTKLFIAFAIANDIGHFRKYIKVLSADGDNSKQITTDIYNMFVSKKISGMYPEIFEKTASKREERMSSFTTSTGVKVVAGTVGQDQRGALQDEARPDLIWYEDFENRKTLRSARVTKGIWDNMEEARTSLAKGGSCIYTCNYISEMGNVHKVATPATGRKVLIIPIIENGVPTWDRYTVEEINKMRETDDDFEGERLCKPSASKDIMFDRERLEAMPALEPKKVSAGFKIFKQFKPGHRYGSGHDVAGGLGLDHSTSVFIDFSTIPARVVATFASNTLDPESFGDEIYREQLLFGDCLSGIENNKYDQAILKAKLLGANLFAMPSKDTSIEKTRATQYGWNTNSLTKPKMLMALAKAVEDGLLELSDPALIAECRSYTRHDLLDNEKDVRLTTRHFDLLIAAAIAWQMKDYAKISEEDEEDDDDWEEDEVMYEDIGI